MKKRKKTEQEKNLQCAAALDDDALENVAGGVVKRGDFGYTYETADGTTVETLDLRYAIRNDKDTTTSKILTHTMYTAHGGEFDGKGTFCS